MEAVRAGCTLRLNPPCWEMPGRLQCGLQRKTGIVISSSWGALKMWSKRSIPTRPILFNKDSPGISSKALFQDPFYLRCLVAGLNIAAGQQAVADLSVAVEENQAAVFGTAELKR